MNILIAKSPWEIYGDPLEAILQRIVGDGYDAVEINIFDRPEPQPSVLQLLRDTRLPVIVQIGTGGYTIDEHLRSLQERYEHALAASPLFVNCHTGKDYFSFDDNLRIFRLAEKLVDRHAVPICHESHRGRALFSLPASLQFLRALPSLRMTADLSHWCCVHESDLADQENALAELLPHFDHIHARVGFSEGPQVSDPRNPSHAPWVERFMALWSRIVTSAAQRGLTRFTLTPEFGPVNYMPLRGREEVPVADPWEINLWMKTQLKSQLF